MTWRDERIAETERGGQYLVFDRISITMNESGLPADASDWRNSAANVPSELVDRSKQRTIQIAIAILGEVDEECKHMFPNTDAWLAYWKSEYMMNGIF